MSVNISFNKDMADDKLTFANNSIFTHSIEIIKQLKQRIKKIYISLKILDTNGNGKIIKDKIDKDTKYC